MDKLRFYEISDFPALFQLGKNWIIIRDEFARLNAPLLKIDRVGKTHEQVIDEISRHMQSGGKFGWLQGWGEDGANQNWLQYALVVNDQAVPFLDGQMPETTKLLSRIKGVKVCAFSKMRPHSFLSTHRHPELEAEGLLQCHITIDAPSAMNYCYLNVAGEFRQHLPGAGFVFDGSLDHFAVNASAAERTILYIEFQRDRQWGL